jgi:hypothetical protein
MNRTSSNSWLLYTIFGSLLSFLIIIFTSTPEVHALLQQMSVMACRLIDAASSGKSKQMICDFNEVAWSGVEVLADPSTTLALAEVTAYLCHALEMQDATRTLGTATTRTSATTNSKTSTTHSFIDVPVSPYRKRRRHNRHALQERIYTRPALLSDPDATVEQIILSSLGVESGQGDDTEEEDEDDVTLDEKSRTTLSRGGRSVLDLDLPPPKVVVTNIRGPAHEEEEEEDNNIDEEVRRTTPRVNHHKTGTAAPPNAMDWNDRARDEVNVELLRERIGERAAALTSQRQRPQPQKGSASSSNNNTLSTTLVPLGLQDDGKATTVEETSNPKNSNANFLIRPTIEKTDPDLEDFMIPGDSMSVPQGAVGRRQSSSAKSIKNINNPENNESDEYNPASQARRERSERRNGETPVDHFYRILDEVMEERRDKGVNLVLSRMANSLAQSS